MFVFFKDTETTEIYPYGHTLSLNDAFPISETADATVEVPELSDASLAEDDTAAAIEAVLAVEADTGAPAALSLPDDGGGATAQDEPVTAGSADDQIGRAHV